MSKKDLPPFTGYQKFIIAILAFLQFTVILDFMVLSPLGFMLMDMLKITPKQFALVVSAYAFSAGLAGLLTAGFADRFDRKKLLLFFYCGFIVGTFCCGFAPSYHFLLAARVLTGLFGGVLSSISMAIITDIFPLEQRGRVMGFTQMAFAASQVLGIPVGLILANNLGWHSPFWMIASFGVIVGVLILAKMKPIVAHLATKIDKSPIHHLIATVRRPDYLRGFLASVLLATGGFMLMPFGTDFSTHNLGLKPGQLPFLFGVTGVASMVLGPVIGKFSDKVGKYKVFLAGTLMTSVIVLIYTHFGITPLWVVMIINVLLFAGISSRMIPAQALMSAIPDTVDRGAFMSINSSMMQISGGVASFCAGLIVREESNGNLANYDILGYVVVAAMLVVAVMLYFINRYVQAKADAGQE